MTESDRLGKLESLVSTIDKSARNQVKKRKVEVDKKKLRKKIIKTIKKDENPKTHSNKRTQKKFKELKERINKNQLLLEATDEKKEKKREEEKDEENKKRDKEIEIDKLKEQLEKEKDAKKEQRILERDGE